MHQQVFLMAGSQRKSKVTIATWLFAFSNYRSSSSEDLILPKITTSNTVLPKAQPKKLTKEEEAENLRRFNANLKRVANLKKKSQMKAVLQAPAAPLASSKPAVSGRVQHVLPGSRQFAPLAFKHSSRGKKSMLYCTLVNIPRSDVLFANFFAFLAHQKYETRGKLGRNRQQLNRRNSL